MFAGVCVSTAICDVCSVGSVWDGVVRSVSVNYCSGCESVCTFLSFTISDALAVVPCGLLLPGEECVWLCVWCCVTAAGTTKAHGVCERV